eukprot:1672826-Rhodomonas_salina.1
MAVLPIKSGLFPHHFLLLACRLADLLTECYADLKPCRHASVADPAMCCDMCTVMQTQSSNADPRSGEADARCAGRISSGSELCAVTDTAWMERGSGEINIT